MGGYPVGSLIKIPEPGSFKLISSKMGRFPFAAQEAADTLNSLENLLLLEPDVDKFPEKKDEKIISRVS